MRLTVGPLPASIYWRRRAVVLGAAALVVLVIFYSCTGPPDSSAQPAPGGSRTSSAASVRPSTTRSDGPQPTAASTAPMTPAQTPYTLPQSTLTGDCQDTELDVSATAAKVEVSRGQALDITIKISNISNRTCARDIGADQQELRLVEGATIVWSSDDCSPNHGRDVRSFTPKQFVSFTITWDGRRSRSGTGAKTCGADAKAPDPAAYQVIARLADKLSSPFALGIRA